MRWGSKCTGSKVNAAISPHPGLLGAGLRNPEKKLAKESPFCWRESRESQRLTAQEASIGFPGEFVTHVSQLNTATSPVAGRLQALNKTSLHHAIKYKGEQRSRHADSFGESLLVDTLVPGDHLKQHKLQTTKPVRIADAIRKNLIRED